MYFDVPDPILGTPLAEVYSIIINTNGKQCALYGTIEVKDDIGTLCIYDVKKENAEKINERGCLSLSNSNRVISASSHFDVYFDLRDRNENDAELINGSFFWSDERMPESYDDLLVEEVVGKTGLGSATVNYIVHSVAVEAVIIAQLSSFEDHAATTAKLSIFEGRAASSDGDRGSDDVDSIMSDGDSIMSNGDSIMSNGDSMMSDGDSTSNYVFGTLVARYKRFYCDANNGAENHRIVLFNESMDTAVEMRDKCYLPLPKFIVSVPSYSSLSIEAKLWRRLPNGSKEVAWTGEVEFPAAYHLGTERIIEGKADRGAFKLGVRWFHYYEDLIRLKNMKKDLLHGKVRVPIS